MNRAEKFAARLRQARDVKRLSQTELAERARLQPSAISHFETGRRTPSFENLRKLADALDVTVDYLLARTDKPRSSSSTAQQLFRNFEQMSADDQESLADFAELLAKRNRERRGGTGSES